MKKLALSLISILICSLSSAIPVNAQDTTSNFIEDNAAETRLDAPTNLGKFSDETINRSAASLNRALAGDELAGLNKTIPYAYRPSSYYGKGIIPGMIEYTAYLMNRPIRTSEYIADVLHNTGIVKQAYAQGIGFAGLSPILQIWKGFRNLSYFLFIIVFVVIGFMIMFRKKVGSNTIVTIQESLPKIIITLLMITFSYAIAGFVIDLMYFSIYLIAGLLESSNIITSSKDALATLFNRNIINIGMKYFTGSGEVAGVAAEGMGQLISQALGGLLGTLGNAVFYLIFLVAVVIAVFKTFIQLVTAYIGIILSTIFAPLQLLPNAFPGNDAFEKWLKGLVANAIVFPVACALILIGASLTGRNNDNNNDLGSLISPDAAAGYQYGGFIPPLLYSEKQSTANENTGGSSGGSTNAIRALIGFGMIMLLPELIKVVKEAMQVKDADYGGMASKNAGVLSKSVGQAGGLIVGGYLEHEGHKIIPAATQRLKDFAGKLKSGGRKNAGPPVSTGGDNPTTAD